MTTAKQLLTEAGLHESHWGTRIIEAEGRGRFVCSDHLDAGRWTTCACGKTDKHIPRRDNSGKPVDFHLFTLGVTFTSACGCENFARAAQTLIAIEKRAGEVLAELEAAL